MIIVNIDQNLRAEVIEQNFERRRRATKPLRDLLKELLCEVTCCRVPQFSCRDAGALRLEATDYRCNACRLYAYLVENPPA